MKHQPLTCHCGRCGVLTGLAGRCPRCGAGVWTQVLWDAWWIGVPAGVVVLLLIL